MDEGRKRVLWICATILAAKKLAALDNIGNDSQQVKIISDALCNAERIMRQIDARWPGNRVPGKT